MLRRPAFTFPPRLRDREPPAEVRKTERAGVIVPIGDTVVAMPKQCREENPHLRSMARKHGCSFRWVLGCLGNDTSTTVLAHENSLAANKGMGYKAHDYRGAYACAVCHSALDQGRIPQFKKTAAMQCAMGRQKELYREILSNPAASPKDRAAAQWALDRLEPKKVATTTNVPTSQKGDEP